MTHSNRGKRNWKQNRKRRRQEDARRRHIDERLLQPGFREEHHREYVRLLMCKRKHAYRSEEEAIRGCIHASFNTGQPFRSYECPVCHQWHITSRAEAYAQ